MMGGQPTPGIGWAAGVERLCLVLPDGAPPSVQLAVIPLGEACERACFQLVQTLRAQGVSAELLTQGAVGKRLKRASERLGADFAAVMGEEELNQGTVNIKNLSTGQQSPVAIGSVNTFLAGQR
jgi:histidyl-tRNA synthetase